MTTIEELDPYGTDIGISAEGDLLINQAGDISLAGGLNVLAQALMLRVRTTPGELILHPDFGIEHPIGTKLNPAALGAAIQSELASVPAHDPRFESVTVERAESPVQGYGEDAVQLVIQAIAAGGLGITVAGLPGEAQITEVTPAAAESPLAELGEEVLLGPEEEALKLAEFNATQSLINDMEGPE